jgi:hydrogenase nickel incorporation protein HypA/HybF
MHELTLARNLIELACEHARAQGASRVKRIQVRLGVLSGMLKPLHFCFGPASRGTLCEDALLEIEEVPLTVECPKCQAVKVPHTRYSFRCPTCGTPTPKVVTGRELMLVALELEGKKPPKSRRPASRPARRRNTKTDNQSGERFR